MTAASVALLCQGGRVGCTLSDSGMKTKSESQKQNLEWNVQATDLKLKTKQKDGSATRFDVMQAKQMGKTLKCHLNRSS